MLDTSAYSPAKQNVLRDVDLLRLDIWNCTKQAYSREKHVHQLVSDHAAAAPDAVAVVHGSLSLSYRELERRANRLAHLLRSLGVGPDVLVGLYLNRSPAMVVGALAILKAGGAYLPLDPSYPADRLRYLLNDAQAPVVVTGRCLAETLPVRPQEVVVVDPEGQIGGEQPSDSVLASVEDKNLAYVIYTSGSTGQPKGVELTHGGLLNLVLWHQLAFKVTAHDRASQLASLGFDAAVWEVWPYLTSGASVDLAEGLAVNDPIAVRDWLISRRVTISFLPTPLAERVIALQWPTKPTLRVMLTGADTLHHYPSRKVRFQLVNNYGPTECTVVATSGVVPPTPECADRLPTIGRPIANTRIYILNERRQQVPVGESGEIYIAGPGLARGYRNRPDLTLEKFIPNPFSTEPESRLYRTGDLACYLPNGEIAFLGRVDEQIKIRGYRIEPAEIVRVLDEHPDVEASTVMAREDEQGDKHLVAYFVPVASGQPTHTGLRNFVASRMPAYMIPAAFVKVDALPLNTSGKVDRAMLPAPDSTNTLRDNAFVAPRTPIEERLASILASLLDMGQVSVEDNFFLLGGHSLLGTQLIARVRDAFDIELSLRSLFDGPTVSELSAQVESLLIAKLESMTEDEAQRLLGGATPATAA